MDEQLYNLTTPSTTDAATSAADEATTLDFDYRTAEDNHAIIKVVGVGGGGMNAVAHMYEEGIQDVTFLVINTDKQALKHSPVPNRLQISEKGLGAGAQPEVARQYAEENAESIRAALNDGTEMVFITAGMGGGTGTGAGPVVSQIAQELGILTVGIVTIPFAFEGSDKIQMALDGVDEMRKHVDALLVVNNDRLIDIYPDLDFFNAFSKADDTLAIAARSISDIINRHGHINLDFADVSTTLRGSGVALISTGTASGEGRVTKAIQAAIKSPLLLDNDISNATHLLFELCFSSDYPTRMEEIGELNSFIRGLNPNIKVIWGAMVDESLGENVKIILLSSGFDFKGGDVVPADQTVMSPEEIAARQAAELERLKSEAIAAAREKLRIIEETNANLIKLGQKPLPVPADVRDVLGLPDEPTEPTATVAETSAPVPDTTAAPVRTIDAVADEAEPTPQPTIEAATPTPPVTPAPAPVTTAAAAPAPASQPAPTTIQTATTASDVVIEPAKSTQDGIDRIRQYYGDKAADTMQREQARQNYYILDKDELTNENLVALLEQLPAYNRSIEQLGQLKAHRSTPARPSVAQDETLQF